jgi:small subunit ribosomal protein S6
MMLREYELTVIAKGDLPDNELGNVLAKYEKYMTKDGGQILKKDNWGARKLAFPINKQYRGHYTCYDFVGAPANLSEIERLMRIDDNILRYLSVAIGSNVDVEARKVELVKEAAKAKEEAEMREREEREERMGGRPERGDRE